eukprot:gene9348-1435_t
MKTEIRVSQSFRNKFLNAASFQAKEKTEVAKVEEENIKVETPVEIPKVEPVQVEKIEVKEEPKIEKIPVKEMKQENYSVDKETNIEVLRALLKES